MPRVPIAIPGAVALDNRLIRPGTLAADLMNVLAALDGRGDFGAAVAAVERQWIGTQEAMANAGICGLRDIAEFDKELYAALHEASEIYRTPAPVDHKDLPDAEYLRQHLGQMESWGKAKKRLEELAARADNVDAILSARVFRSESPVQPGAAGSAAEQRANVLKGEAKALALLAQHPDWTNKQIAADVPCSRTTLNTWPKFVAARKAQRHGMAPPRGSKSKSGQIEAEDE